ncbi:MAG: 3,4-dihydroxy-2-butanone-4-phosphate synthase [Burkholderiales bacterium]|nr:3,4-dihydroxy-2-butanone-4-phosphate synthase [Burkholderiales bacterium]
MFNTIEDAISDLQQGKLIIVCDNEDRENEGDFLGIAELMTEEQVNFMITHGKGLVCVPLAKEYAKNFGLNPMVQRNEDNMQTAFTQSVDYKTSTTGISAKERMTTILELANKQNIASDFRAPGHIFPLVAKDGGVIVRPGHTEAAVDLAKLSGFTPVGVICEIINDDGTMARVPELIKIAEKFDMKMIHIENLIEYRKANDKIINKVSSARLPTKHGEFNMIGYQSIITHEECIALVKEPLSGEIPLVRIHSECLTGDGFASLRCDCGEQLERSMEEIHAHGGVLIYLRQEGRGIGLLNKIKAYALQDLGMDTVEANLHLGFPDDMREYYLAAQILQDLGYTKINLLSNNPRKFSTLEKYGITIASRKELIIKANSNNKDYLSTKVTKLGHILG